MREGWEYKKLGDLCQTCSGGTPSKSHSEYYEGGKIPWLRSGEVAQGDINKTELFITELGLANSSAKIVPPETVCVTMYGATIGEVGVIKTSMCTNQAICNILPNDYFNPHFLRYFLMGKKNWYISIAAGGAQPNISQDVIRKTLVPTISMQSQLAIVSELDKINELIRLKKEQLVEYDNLAQSIFYEMFGDPVENEKGWELKKFINVVTLQRGYDLPTQQRDPSGSIPVYGSNGVLGYHSESKLDSGIITGRSGTIGEVYISKTPCWPLNTTLFSKETHGNNLIYLCYFLRFFDLKRFVQGAGVPTLNRNNFHEKMIIAPPLEFQQTFASRIEQIEKLKSEVQNAITDLETLLASRMQYWFE